MEPINIDGTLVYNVADIESSKKYNEFCIGYKADKVSIIEQNKIPEDKYFIATFAKNNWKIRTKDSRVRGFKILVDKTWFDENIKKTRTGSVISKASFKRINEHDVVLTSCIYLFEIGDVSDTRHVFGIPENIPGDYKVCKYGKTIDLERRFGEHETRYKLCGIKKIHLRIFASIMRDKIGNAEDDIEKFFKDQGWHLNNKTHTEVVAVPPCDVRDVRGKISTVRKTYKEIADKYDHVKVFQEEIEKLKLQK